MLTVNIDRINDSYDRIRKWDAFLHMFAAVSFQSPPLMGETKHPTSVEDFSPSQDFEIDRGGRSLSVSFEVVNITGELAGDTL